MGISANNHRPKFKKTVCTAAIRISVIGVSIGTFFFSPKVVLVQESEKRRTKSQGIRKGDQGGSGAF